MALLMIGAAVFSALLVAAPGRRRRSRRASPATTCSASSRSPPRSASASSSRATRSRRWSRSLLAPLVRRPRARRCRLADELGRPRRALRRHRLDLAAGRLGGAPGALRDLPRQPGELLLADRCAALPRLHRPLQARRRLRRLAADAVPAPGDAIQHGRGRRRQQGDRPLADDRRRAARRRAHDPARPVARADAVRRPADAQQRRLLVAGGERPRRCCPASSFRPSTGASSSWPSRRRSTAGC